MDNREAVNWLIDISADIGKAEHSDLWHYEQALTEIKDMLESAQLEERKESLCKKVRALCEESKIEFFFVGGGESTWSVTNDKHIKKIVECHKAQLSLEGTTKDATILFVTTTGCSTADTISRQATIDAINTWDKFGVDERGRLVRWHEGLEPYVHLRDVLTAIVNLPPAQPEESTEERTESHACDLITTIQNGIKATDANDVYSCGMRNGMRWCMSLIDGKSPLYENCPSAQPKERTETHAETRACDLILRQAAIDAAELAYVRGMFPTPFIREVPPAQPERKKGKWKFEKMKHIINGEVRDAIICSECDSGYFRYDISDNTVQNIPNFCPNCGADMRGENNE